MFSVTNLLFALLLASALSALALWRRALTPGGLALAWTLGVVIAFCGGLTGFLALTAVFLCTIAAGKLSGARRERIEKRLHAKTGRRDAAQVACNVATGAALLLFYALTGWRGFLWAAGGALAASLADSMASELGVLAKAEPRDILSGKPVPRGLSGGVTAFGFGMSALGAAIVAGICALGWPGGWALFASLTLAGTLGAALDSVLGSAVQAKYRCPACGALTEKPLHCSVPGTVERGAAWMTNDLVNLSNNLFGALAALGLYALLG